MARKNTRKNREKMRRAGAVLLAAVLLCGLTACGESGGKEEKGSEEESIGSAVPDWTVGNDGQSESGQTSEQETEEDKLQNSEQDDEEASRDSEQEAGEGVEESAESAAPPEFSAADWKTLEFALNGQVFTFPMTWSDIEAAGYRFHDEYRQEVLEPGYYATSITAKNEAGEYFSVQFKNFGEEAQKLEDCYVRRVSFYYTNNPTAMLCNGVAFHMTLEEVKEIMGEPDYFYTNVTDDEPDPEYVHENMEYYVTGSSRESEIEIDFMNGVMTEIKITNTD